MPTYYSKLGHVHFLLQTFRLMVHSYAIIRHSPRIVGFTEDIVKPTTSLQRNVQGKI